MLERIRALRLRLPWKGKRRASTNWRDVFLDLAPFTVGILSVLFGTVPIVFIAVVGLIQGVVPDEGGILGEGPGYPLFQPAFWLLWIPGLITLAFAIISIPIPGKSPSPFEHQRSYMWSSAVFGTGMAASATFAYGGPQWISLSILVVMWLFANVLIMLRGLLGWLRLVPRTWR